MIQQLQFDYGSLDQETRAFVQERAVQIHNLARKSATGIMEIGRYLAEVKTRLPHGKFLEWIEQEFAWKRQTAENFMAVYERVKIPNFGNLQIDVSALYLIAAPSTPEPVRQEAIRRAESGESVTHAGTRALIEAFAEDKDIPDQKINLTELIRKRMKLREQNEPPKRKWTREEQEEIDQMRETMKRNSERNSKLMSIIRAIEMLSTPEITMQEAAREISEIDTPDKDWCGQARTAESNLTALIKGLP